MGTQNTAALLQKDISSDSTSSQIANYDVILNSLNGIHVASSAIESIDIRADIFTLLPTVTFRMSNHGAYFIDGTMFVGQTLYFTYTPQQMLNKQNIKPKYVMTKLKIMSITENTNIAISKYDYLVVCCVDAMQVLSRVYPYPPKTMNPAQLVTGETSVNAIKAMLNAGGLNSENDVGSTLDTMIWINTRNKIYECVNKFLDHSWISAEDAMLVYTSFLNSATYDEKADDEEKEKAFKATAHISSCLTLAQKSAEATYVARTNTSHKDICYKFDKIAFDCKAGVSTLEDAYSKTEYLYSPIDALDTDLANVLEFEKADDNTDAGLMKGKYNSGIRKTVYDNMDFEVPLADNTAKIDDLYNGTNEMIDAGMHFYDDTHAHYDVAPAHNRAVISSFFTNKVVITLNMSMQDHDVVLSNALPYVGQKVTLDASIDEHTQNTNLSGEYVVGKVVVFLEKNKTAIFEITLLSNGTYTSANDNELK